MKSIKILALGLSLAFACAGASAQNKFANDQLDNNSQNNGAKTLNIDKIKRVQLVGSTVVILKKDGTTVNWSGGWAIFDRFASGPRNQGADFNYWVDPSTGIPNKISYSSIEGTSCDYVGGANPYQVTANYDAQSGGGTLVAASLSSNFCSNFN